VTWRIAFARCVFAESGCFVTRTMRTVLVLAFIALVTAHPAQQQDVEYTTEDVEYNTANPGPAVALGSVSPKKGWDASTPCVDCGPEKAPADAPVKYVSYTHTTTYESAPQYTKIVKTITTPVPAPPVPAPIEMPMPVVDVSVPAPVPVIHPVIFDKKVVVNNIERPVPPPVPEMHTVVYVPKDHCKAIEHPEVQKKLTWKTHVACPTCEAAAKKAAEAGPETSLLQQPTSVKHIVHVMHGNHVAPNLHIDAESHVVETIHDNARVDRILASLGNIQSHVVEQNKKVVHHIVNPAQVEATHDAVVPLEMVQAEPVKPVEYDTKEPGPAVVVPAVTDKKGWDKSTPCVDCHPVEEVAAAPVYNDYESSNVVELPAPKLVKTVKVTETPVPAPPAPEPVVEPEMPEMPYTPTPVPVVHPVIYDKRIIVNEIMKPVPVPAPQYVKHTVVIAPKPSLKKPEVSWDTEVPCPECEEKTAKAKAKVEAKVAFMQQTALKRQAALKKKQTVLAAANKVIAEAHRAH